MSRKIVVTAALPYANGPIHIGHLVEYVQTDIWVRFQKLVGNECIFLCADDAHGTPIMLRARTDGIEPQELIDQMKVRHEADFRDFLVEFDNFHTTHSPENRLCAERIYKRLKEGGHIVRRTIEQAYDEAAGMFLPDRFVKGTCPRCKAEDQYGDACESCGSTYAPSDLINPLSVVSGQPPVQRTSEHLFFRLADFQQMLDEWTGSQDTLQESVRKKLDDWFEAGLQDWDISRDAPYWGFEIPGEQGKFFYVWMDAPIGYQASCLHYGQTHELDFDAVWGQDSEYELVHFIGKDIAYFHTLFWPAMLHGAGFRRPTAVYCHGFLTVDGRKMSKSRGTFIQARTYLDHLHPEHLRYYYASKLGPGLDDVDLSLQDFVFRVNSDLVGKVVNVASRTSGILAKNYGNTLSEALYDAAQYAEFLAVRDEIAALYEARDYGRAMRQVAGLADQINKFIDTAAPWSLVKDPATFEQGRAICTQALNLYRVLVTYLAPVVPRIAAQSMELLRSELSWQGLDTPLLGTGIEPYTPLMFRIDPKAVDAMLEASKPAPEPKKPTVAPVAEQIGIDDFARVDLRVARVIEAQAVEKAEKLLQLRVDLGDHQRTIFAGIKSAYKPEDLVGRHVIVVANLAPRKMRFGTSEGMALAAADGSGIFLLGVDEGARPGLRVS